jgi:hypothetical protein
MYMFWNFQSDKFKKSSVRFYVHLGTNGKKEWVLVQKKSLKWGIFSRILFQETTALGLFLYFDISVVFLQS